MMQHMVFSDQERRLLEMGGSFLAIEDGRVNLSDLLAANIPGAIVRCRGNPHEVIRVVQLDDGPVGCVAGWISEGEQ